MFLLKNSDSAVSTTDLAETSGPSPTTAIASPIIGENELQNAVEFVNFWALINDLSLDQHKRILLGKDSPDEDLLLAQLSMDYNAYCSIYKKNKYNPRITKVKKEDLKDALKLKTAQLKKSLISSIKRKINQQPATKNLNELAKLVLAITDKEDPYHINLMAHWLQQVKRKLNGRSAYNHIFLILFGAQGSGKTELIKKLLEPLGPLSLPSSIDHLMDERHGKSFENYYVIFLDELMGIDKVDMESLKKKITDETFDHRGLYEKHSSILTNNASFIAASNKPMFENIKDRTGVRRFAEIETVGKMNWGLVNDIDYLEIWRSVDLNFDFYSSIKEQLNTFQAANTSKDSVDHFIDDHEITNTGTLVHVTTKSLNEIFQEWAKKQGYKSTPNRDDFTKAIQQRCSVKKERVRRGDSRPDCFYLSWKTSSVQTGTSQLPFVVEKKE